jgi:diguanylate cyclase (GGDEF)-like protein
MIYQRHIPRDELVAAQLEMLLQNGRRATLSVQLLGAFGAVCLFWPYLGLTALLAWTGLFLLLLLLRSRSMGRDLDERNFQTHPRSVYRRLLLGAAVTGAAWAAAYLYASMHTPITVQYVFLIVVVMVAAFSLSFSVAIREHYIVYVFASLWPMAWWSLAHYQEAAYNLLLGLLLLVFCALMVIVCDRTYRTFRNLIALTWEREHIAQELGDLTGSLRDRNRQLRDARAQLTDLANIDELTGLGNRRLVNTVLQDEINRAIRAGGRLSLILLDVDYFKNYNDHYGHPAGDEVLQKLADVMQRATARAGEVVARYGGEEFILLLPGASAESAMRTAQRLRAMIEGERIPHDASKVAPYVTISQGVLTVAPRDAIHPAELVRQADQALYRAKDKGRNAIAVA